jgi:hypothetical protein
MLADELDYVLGVDTHRDEHVLVAVAAPAGAVVARQAVRANARGYRDTLRFAELYAPGVRAWAIEGTGSYGAGLVRHLAGCGETVLELGRTPRGERRLRGKDDSLDATRTARAALASETLAVPRSGERREALRLLLVARRSAVDVRREALGQLRSSSPPQTRSAKSCVACRPGGCSNAAAVCAARARRPQTKSRPGTCCAALPVASKRPPSRPPN